MAYEKPYQDLWEFHETYYCARSLVPKLPDANTPEGRQLRNLRINLLSEEFDEYLKAEAQSNFIEIADALADIIYICYGTAVAFGIPMDRVFNEVHASNMSKLDPETGKPIYREDKKVMKGPQYFKPDIKKILETTTNSRAMEAKENDRPPGLTDFFFDKQ